MIANDEQHALVRQQIAKLEEALDSLAKTVRRKSEAQYRTFAEGYVDQLDELRRDVEEYLGITGIKKAGADSEETTAPTVRPRAAG